MKFSSVKHLLMQYYGVATHILKSHGPIRCSDRYYRGYYCPMFRDFRFFIHIHREESRLETILVFTHVELLRKLYLRDKQNTFVYQTQR